MSLARFKSAQDSTRGGFAAALAELESGRKTSHWIWYVFPQLAGLGRSAMAQSYALRDFSEACDYLREPVLGERLMRITAVVQAQLRAGVPLEELMGSTIDVVKLVSSLTLFRAAARALGERASFVTRCDEILALAETKGFPPCAHTMAHVPSIA